MAGQVQPAESAPMKFDLSWLDSAARFIAVTARASSRELPELLVEKSQSF